MDMAPFPSAQLEVLWASPLEYPTMAKDLIIVSTKSVRVDIDRP